MGPGGQPADVDHHAVVRSERRPAGAHVGPRAIGGHVGPTHAVHVHVHVHRGRRVGVHRPPPEAHRPRCDHVEGVDGAGGRRGHHDPATAQGHVVARALVDGEGAHHVGPGGHVPEVGGEGALALPPGVRPPQVEPTAGGGDVGPAHPVDVHVHVHRSGHVRVDGPAPDLDRAQAGGGRVERSPGRPGGDHDRAAAEQGVAPAAAADGVGAHLVPARGHVPDGHVEAVAAPVIGEAAGDVGPGFVGDHVGPAHPVDVDVHVHGLGGVGVEGPAGHVDRPRAGVPPVEGPDRRPAGQAQDGPQVGPGDEGVVERDAQGTALGRRQHHALHLLDAGDVGQAADRVHGGARVTEVGPQPVDVLRRVPVPVAVDRAGGAVGPVAHGLPDVVQRGQLGPRERRPVRGVEHVGHHRGQHDGAQGHVRGRRPQLAGQRHQAAVALGHVAHRQVLDVDPDGVDAERAHGQQAGQVGGRVDQLGQVPADHGHAPGVGPVDQGLQAGPLEHVGRSGRRRLEVEGGHALGGQPVDGRQPDGRVGAAVGDRPVEAVHPGAQPPERCHRAGLGHRGSRHLGGHGQQGHEQRHHQPGHPTTDRPANEPHPLPSRWSRAGDQHGTRGGAVPRHLRGRSSPGRRSRPRPRRRGAGRPGGPRPAR